MLGFTSPRCKSGRKIVLETEAVGIDYDVTLIGFARKKLL